MENVPLPKKEKGQSCQKTWQNRYGMFGIEELFHQLPKWVDKTDKVTAITPELLSLVVYMVIKPTIRNMSYCAFTYIVESCALHLQVYISLSILILLICLNQV